MELGGSAVQGPQGTSAAPSFTAATPTATAAAATATAKLTLLAAPKRKRSGAAPPGGMGPRSETMGLLAAQECDCRDSKAGCRGPSRGGTAWLCSFYAAAEAAARAGAKPLLYSLGEAPAVLRFNPYVRSGYRAGLSRAQCCASVFTLHNETGSIWTHLLPALLMLALALGGQLQAWAGAAVSYWVNVGSIALCFLGSVAFHTFSAHHCRYDRLLRLDVCGILLVLVGGGHMVIWWGLACFPAARAAFAAAYAAVGCAGTWAALRARSALQRALPMLLLLALRMALYTTRSLLHGGWGGGGGGSGALSGTAMQHYLAMEACSLAGGLLNVARVPERWLQPTDPLQPAPLDLWLNSHQIMHVLVAAAMWQLHLGAAADYRFVAALASGEATCPA